MLTLGLLMLSNTALAAPPLFIPVQQSTPVDTTPVKSLTVTCPGGRVAISGGAEITGASAGVVLTSSGPDGAPTAPSQWFGMAQVRGPTAGAWGLTVNGLCASPAVAQLIQVVTVTQSPSPGATFVDAIATCPAGTSVISGGVRIYGSVDETQLTASGPEGTNRWYGVGLIPVNSGAGMRVDVFCLSSRLWTSKFSQITQIVSPVAGFAADAAVCPAGTYALGGGARIAGPVDGTALQSINPDPLGLPPLSWSTSAAEVGVAQPGWLLRTDAFCLRP